MDRTELQQLITDQTDGVNPIVELLEPLMPILSLLLVVGVILSVVIIILFIINIVQKQRQHSAIMRIDKNLQQLVDAKLQPRQQETVIVSKEPALTTDTPPEL